MSRTHTLHLAIEDDIRRLPWRSNCAGEVFADDGSEAGLRIGHFQGDAALAAFVVQAPQDCLDAEHQSSAAWVEANVDGPPALVAAMKNHARQT